MRTRFPLVSLLAVPLIVAGLAVFVSADHHEEADVAVSAAAAEAGEAAEHHAQEAKESAEHHAHGDHDADHAGHAEHAEAAENGHAEAIAHAEHAMAHPFLIERAIAVLLPTQGSEVQGTVHFEQIDPQRVRVTAEIQGLTPNAQHGFHIHQYGDVSAPDGKATGGHYNPDGHDHALPTTEAARHAGDLGNLTADANGDASFGMIVENISIAGAHNPVIGRGVIVHAKADDGGQPTGNAGARIAQGVIGVDQ